jgi:hypothetical protein
MSSDPNALQKAEAQKQFDAGIERDLIQCTEKVKTLLKPLPEESRKRVLDDALRELKSSLAVHHGGS